MVLVAAFALRSGLHLRNVAKGLVDHRKMRFFDITTIGFPAFVVVTIASQMVLDTFKTAH